MRDLKVDSFLIQNNEGKWIDVSFSRILEYNS